MKMTGVARRIAEASAHGRTRLEGCMEGPLQLLPAHRLGKASASLLALVTASMNTATAARCKTSVLVLLLLRPALTAGARIAWSPGRVCGRPISRRLRSAAAGARAFVSWVATPRRHTSRLLTFWLRGGETDAESRVKMPVAPLASTCRVAVSCCLQWSRRHAGLRYTAIAIAQQADQQWLGAGHRRRPLRWASRSAISSRY